jgi:TonB-linked SusC/RagA family outer membrane protein
MKMKKLHSILFFMLLFMQIVNAQESRINGIVKSESDGLPIPGVSVIIKGTSKSSTTDFDGKYSILASPADVLSFSFVGFETQSVSVGSKTNVNVTLVEQVSSLNEVVVMGSTIRVTRKEMGNAVTSLKSDDLLKAQPTSLTSALQGKIAGAQISQNSGDPSGGFSIKLRGTSSILGSSDPLYVVDGVIISNASTNVTNPEIGGNTNVRIGQNRTADINPNDIESVEVLNGSAAAAIYGSRAANGVVIITTKKGKSGDASYVFSTSVVVNSLRKKLDINLVNKQFATSATALFPISGNTASATTININRGLGPNQTVPAGTAINIDTQLIDVTRYDYQDDIFETGVGTDSYFSVKGGDLKTNYFASIGYLDNGGIVKNTDFKRLGLNLKIQNKMSEKLTASFGVNYVTSRANEKPDGNVFYSPINSSTITNNIYNLSNRDANGNLLAVDPGRVNPLSVIETFNFEQETDRIISDIQLNYKPFKNFTADFIVGLDNYNTKGYGYIPRYPYSPVNIANYNLGFVSETSNKVYQMNNDLNLRYLWEISENFTATTYGGYNIQMYRDKYFSVSGIDLRPFITTINAANTINGGGAVAEESKFNLWGYYLQETFAYKNKLFITGAIRQDASTIFARDKREQYYPKISGSYVLSDEKFMKNIPVSSARLRASWGESGNLTAIGSYSRFTNYASSNFIGNTAFGLSGNSRGNDDLIPERSVTLEYGADLGFFDDRLTLSGSIYNADIKDLLLRVQTAASTGATTSIENLGTMNNKGFELSMKATPIQTDNFTLEVFGNYSTNKNKVTGLNQPFYQLDSNPAGAPIFVQLGQPIGIYYGSYYARNEDGSLLLMPSGLPQTERGDSATNTPQRTAGGQPYGDVLNKQIGDPNPDFIYAFGTNLRYKKWGLSALFDGVEGGDIWDADYRTRQGVGSGNLVAQELNGELPRGYIWSIYNIQEFRVVDGSYLKLRELSVNYSFGKLNKVFDDLTINLSGRNLYSWDKFTSYDPEVNSAGQSSVAKYNFGTVPIPRTFALALKFQF